MIYRPVRERNPENVVQMMMDGLKNGGFDEASLTCLSTADYSAVTPLVIELLDKLHKELELKRQLFENRKGDDNE
jgi:hypothetical protein